jgi:hypothetical protein
VVKSLQYQQREVCVMTDKNKPEELKDEDLDNVAGGFIAVNGGGDPTLKTDPKKDPKGSGFIAAQGGADPTLKKDPKGDGFVGVAGGGDPSLKKT